MIGTLDRFDHRREGSGEDPGTRVGQSGRSGEDRWGQVAAPAQVGGHGVGGRIAILRSRGHGPADDPGQVWLDDGNGVGRAPTGGNGSGDGDIEGTSRGLASGRRLVEHHT